MASASAALTASSDIPYGADQQISKRKLSILDLPIETQKDIFKNSTSTDLIALALVSRHFHLIASAQLYRNFSIVFPDEEDPSFDCPIDGLAGGLDTLVTSQYDYARHLKEICLDTLSGGERAYRHYLYEVSCGKFMNTLFLLTLRKAKALETFHWNIRVELSRPLFNALHQLPSLRNFHIRLQAGHSLYEPPPPLPSSLFDGKPPIPTAAFSNATLISPPLSNPSVKVTPLSAKITNTAAELRRREPPTFSGLKNLTTLSVLDMDTLEYVSEIAVCIRNSATTLKKLKLSLSESLAKQARKPGLEESDVSDEELDEFGNTLVPPPPPPPAVTSSTPEKEAKINSERLAQEAVLGKLFGIEKSTISDTEKCLDSKQDIKDEEINSKPEEDPGRAFIKDLKAVTSKLMMTTTGLEPHSNTKKKHKEALELMIKAAEKYVMSNAGKPTVDSASSSSNPPPSNIIVPEGENKLSDLEVKSSVIPLLLQTQALEIDRSSDKGKGREVSKGSESLPKSEPGGGIPIEPPKPLNSSPLKQKPSLSPLSDNLEPEDIDIYQPEAEDVDDTEDQEVHWEAIKDQEQPERSKPTDGKTNLLPKTCIRRDEDSTDKHELIHSAPSSKDLPNSSSDTSQNAPVTNKIPDLSDNSNESIKDYIRSTRKLELHTLALYLIPIRASVLSRSVDLSILQKITLLNVGPQTSFWTHMHTIHKTSALRLQSINTDHVTPTFLSLVNDLHHLKEIFLLERTSKSNVESLAPKTSVTIEDIRKQVLKKHIRTLKKIMIKNEHDYTWDADGKSIKILSNRGTQLTELALSLNLRNVHLLLQNLSGLPNLKALHILSFRSDDMCNWVLRELRKFAADAVALNPDMKLEYIGLDKSVERLIKPVKKVESAGTKIPTTISSDALFGNVSTFSNTSSTEPDGDGSTTGISPPITVSSPLNQQTKISTAIESIQIPATPPVAPVLIDDDNESSDEESSNEESQPDLKIETVETKFYEVFGIKIFRKDIKAGRL